MIKIVLKHFLYEQAINVFFKEVVNNFVRPNIEQSVVDKIIEMANQIRMQQISITPRTISSQYVLEPQSDLTSYHSDEIEDMLLEILREELDREVRSSDGGWSGLGYNDAGIIYSPYIPVIFSSTEKS